MAEGVVEVKLLFFAKSRELVGRKEAELSVERNISAVRLHQHIISAYPILQPIQDNVVLAYKDEYLPLNDAELQLNAGDEIAIIPPLSGAAEVCNVCAIRWTMDHVSVTECPLSIEQMTQLVTSPSSGAIATFIGTTRDDFDGKKVVRLEYEAYQPMAEQQLRKICGEVRSKWPAVERMAIAHRTGLVPVAESSVIIAISSPHRRDALEGVQYAIDVLKASVPIWKKEIYEESESKWKENRECPWSAQ